MIIRVFLVKKNLIQSTMRQSGAEMGNNRKGVRSSSSHSVTWPVQSPTTESEK